MSDENDNDVLDALKQIQSGPEVQIDPEPAQDQETEPAKAEEDIEPSKEEVTYAKAPDLPTKNKKDDYPYFMDAAEKLPRESQNLVAKYKRLIKGDLSSDNLLWATGEEVTTFKIKQGLVMPVLKMRIDNDNAPVYIFASQAGANYRHLENFIAQHVKISILTLAKTDSYDEEGNHRYIALGSIQQAEFTINGEMYKDYVADPDKFKSQDRVGIVTQVIETPSFGFVSFQYQGVELGMLAKNFYYQSFTRPLSQVAKIGMKIKFRVTDIKRVNYEDQAGIKEDMQKGYPTPKGMMYQVMTTRLPFLESPDASVIRRFKEKTEFTAHIVGVDSVLGILVEIAPGWQIKGYLSSKAPFEPSVQDARNHTVVVVRILSLNTEKRMGKAAILRFPMGVAPKEPSPQNQ